MSVGKRDYFSRMLTLLVFLILNGTAKTKLTILPFFCCEEIVKNSIEKVGAWQNTDWLVFNIISFLTDERPIR